MLNNLKVQQLIVTKGLIVTERPHMGLAPRPPAGNQSKVLFPHQLHHHSPLEYFGPNFIRLESSLTLHAQAIKLSLAKAIKAH